MKKKYNILVIDDDIKQLDMLTSYLEKHGFKTIRALNGVDGFDKIQNNSVDMVISDMRMPEMTGMEFYQKIRENNFKQPILFITAFPDVRDAVTTMRDGAANYLEKPIDFGEMLDSVACALNIKPEKSNTLKIDLPEGVIVKSKNMMDVIDNAAIIANSDVSVIISGESGTGKEILADLIHKWSDRSTKQFVKINCASIPENLMESELFGYTKGAFSGANKNKLGLLEQANGGTVMLDEIGEMPLGLQSKLLRVTQDGTFIPLGGNKERKIDIRIIAATNRNLYTEVQEKRFREDLYYRLSTFEFQIPALRERKADIIPLALYFANQNSNFGRKRISESASEILLGYEWPGNIRELQNEIKRAVLLTCGGDTILPEYFSSRIRDAVNKEMNSSIQDSEEGVIDKMEREIIFKTLEKNQFNRSLTAKDLKMSRRTLTYKIRRYRDAGYDI